MRTPWKIIKECNYTSTESCVNQLIAEGYKPSDWIKDIARTLPLGRHSFPFTLYRIHVSDLGLQKACKLKIIYKRFSEEGFAPVPPDIALLTRFLYDEQPQGEWLRIATPFDSMIDSDGVPHLPKLGHALGKYFIETYWSYPDAIFHPHNDFIVAS